MRLRPLRTGDTDCKKHHVYSPKLTPESETKRRYTIALESVKVGHEAAQNWAHDGRTRKSRERDGGSK